MALVDGLLTHVCDLLAPQMAATNRGTPVNQGSTVVAAQLPCVIDQASDRTIDMFGGKQQNMTHVGYFEITAKDFFRMNQVITNVAPSWDPTNYEKDDFGTAGLQPIQYRVLDAKVPNLEPDHVEVALEQMQGRRAAPVAP